MAMAVGLATIYWGKVVVPAKLSVIAKEVKQSYFDINKNKYNDEIAAAPTAPRNDSASPKYTGQFLSYLGDPKIIARYPKEFVERYRKQLDNVVFSVRQYPKDEVYWIEAGIIKKQFDNFIGARDAWEYARILNPRSGVAYHNLGNLYSLYLQDFKKAEVNYQAFLSLDRLTAQPYLVLSDFYKDFYKEKSGLADDVLLAGLEYLPEDPNLILNLAIYYKSVGDKAEAIKYFEWFLKLPDLNGAQVAAVQKELESLKSL